HEYARRSTVTPSRAASAGSTSGAITWTRAPASSRPSTLLRATRPPPTTRQRVPANRRLTGYCGSSTGMRLLTDCRRCGFPALLVEAQDLQLDGEIDLAQRHARRDGD